MAAPSALLKAMQLSERTVVVGEVPAELCASGAADVRIGTLLQQFGDVIAVCLHPQSDGTAGWGTATFAEPNEAARAVRAACVEVEVADADGGAPRARTLPLQRATLAMESRALAAVQIGGRGPAPIRRRGHTSFRTSDLSAGDGAEMDSPRQRKTTHAEIAERSALVRDTIVEVAGSPHSPVDQATQDRAVERLLKDLPSRLWSAMQTLRKPPAQRTQRDVSALVSMARHQQIGFITRLTGPEQRRLCAVLKLEVLPSGHELYKEGDAATAMHIILYGAVTATTRQGGGGNQRRVQLLMGHADSEEESGGEEDDADGALLVSEKEDARAGGVLTPRDSASISARGSASATTQARPSAAAASGLRPQGTAAIETEERRLGDLGVGQHFGELALLKPGSVRTATVVVREPSVLLQVKQAEFAEAMRLGQEDQVELQAQLTRLRNCPIFQGLPLRTLLDLAELVEYRLYPKDTVLYEQGAPATEMSLVLSGRVTFSAKIRRRQVSPPRTRTSSGTPASPKGQTGKKDQRPTHANSPASKAAPGRLGLNLVMPPGIAAAATPSTPRPAAAPSVEYWHVKAGNIGAGGVLGCEGLPPEGEKTPLGAGRQRRHEAVQHHRWTTTTTNDVEVLKIRVHTLVKRTSPVVIERLQEYIRAELTRPNLEKAVEREQHWQQKRSELFVHITGKGHTRKQIELQEMWAGRAARAALASSMVAATPVQSPADSQKTPGGMSVTTLTTLRKRSQTINTTGQRHKQEVRWIERLKVRTAEMTEKREEWREDPELQKDKLNTEWAKVHTDFVQTMGVYDQLSRANWDPMTSAAAPATLELNAKALLDGRGASSGRGGAITPQSAKKKGTSRALGDTKEVVLRDLKLNSSLYSVAYEETLVLCGSIGCADPETQSFGGFGFLSWLYWVESLLGRFEKQLEDEGMAERFTLVRVGTEGFRIMALPAPTAAQHEAAAADSSARTDANAAAQKSLGPHESLGTVSAASSMADAVEGGRDSLAWSAEKLLQFGLWMLDEAKATNDKAERIDRTTVNASHTAAGGANDPRLRPAGPTTGLVDTGDDDVEMEKILDNMHYVHGGRKGLIQTHRVDLQLGIASGQCAAYALGISHPAFFHLKGPVVEGVDKLCKEAKGGCLLMSPAVEHMVSKSVDGLTRVPMKIEKIARTAAERAALEAEKELEDVVAAQRALEDARRAGSIEMIHKAEQQLAVEQEEADEAVRVAEAAKARAAAAREEALQAEEAARQARIAAATGPHHYEFGWRNGQRNTDGLTPREVKSADTRRRLMSHRPPSAPATARGGGEGRGTVRPNTAPAARRAQPQPPPADNSAAQQQEEPQQDGGSDGQKQQQQQQQQRRTKRNVVGKVPVPSALAARPQSARPVLQNSSSVLQMSWRTPAGIGRPGSAFAASATAMPRRRPRPQSSGAAARVQLNVGQAHTMSTAAAATMAASVQQKRQQPIAPHTPSQEKQRPQSAHSRVPSPTSAAQRRPASGLRSARLYASPARRIMERHRPEATRPASAAATGQAKKQVTIGVITAVQQGKAAIDDPTGQQQQAPPGERRPTSARPVLENYAFAAQA
jgi:CRP-like cAMP-binding protein